VIEHAGWLRDSGELSSRRWQAAQTEVLAGLRTELERRLDDRAEGDPRLQELVAQVARRDRSPHRAVSDLLSRLEFSFSS
jgi:hypothetical protein